MFRELIDKHYPRALYDQQFSLYVDNIVARIDLQIAEYSKEKVPQKLFDILGRQKAALLVLKEELGPVIAPDRCGY